MEAFPVAVKGRGGVSHEPVDSAFLYADSLGYPSEREVGLILTKAQKDIECSFGRTDDLPIQRLLLSVHTVGCI